MSRIARIARIAVLAVTALALLTGCAGSIPEGAAPDGAVPAAPAPAAQPEGLSDLGNLPKQFGEAAQIGPDGGEPLMEFTLGDPVEATCDQGFGDGPENGRFVELPVAVQTFDDAEGMLVLLNPTAHSFEFVDADGRSHGELGTMSAATSCGYDSPMELRPNRSYDYPVVLDLPEGPGTLVLDLGAAAGWEWQLG
ncbi:hypothetical protein [Pseudonocardia sp.]|uniref:hypothetical protein n=1 Tax=Pseudonocardia sp. TaxID=60912 RepID=UPI002612516F|nr:hypothetical protein [Pseudonocardia sp.]